MKNNYEVKVGDYITSPSTSYLVYYILGSGSFGNVFLCRKTSNLQLVALKVLKQCGKNSGEREARMLLTLQEGSSGSHHIVRCLDSFQFKGHYCYEFEALDISLWDFLGTVPDHRLQLNQIRPIIAQMARALLFLKTKGIAHSDLKPENIMLTSQVDQPLSIKLIDFGLAYPVKEHWPNYMLQTFSYRAPEVHVKSSVTEAIDMWSVGCIAAEMFLGESLFPHAKYDCELMAQITQLLGKPPKRVLNSGKLTHEYFRRRKHSKSGSFKIKVSPGQKSSLITSLDDIIHFNSEEMITEAEMNDRILFVDLLKRMLEVNPKRRITPEDVLNHPFITMNPMKQWFPSYYSESQEIMAQVLSFSSEEQQQSGSTSCSQVTVVADATEDSEGQRHKRSREDEEEWPQKRTSKKRRKFR